VRCSSRTCGRRPAGWRRLDSPWRGSMNLLRGVGSVRGWLKIPELPAWGTLSSQPAQGCLFDAPRTSSQYLLSVCTAYELIALGATRVTLHTTLGRSLPWARRWRWGRYRLQHPIVPTGWQTARGRAPLAFARNFTWSAIQVAGSRASWAKGAAKRPRPRSASRSASAVPCASAR